MSRAFKTWLKRADSGVLTSSELMWLGHELSGNHRRSTMDWAERDTLQDTLVALHDRGQLTVDRASSDKGLAWLKNLAFTPKTQQRRKNSPFMLREEAILKDFDHFEVGAFERFKRHGLAITRPIFRVVDTHGNFFDYVVWNTRSDYMSGCTGPAIMVLS